MIIAPSFLSADWSKLSEEIESCNSNNISHIHFDVMDGNFVPPITFGDKFISDLRPKSKALFDVHLMVETPNNFFKSMIDAGADAITFHIEATRFSIRNFMTIKKINQKTKLGIAVNPQTPVSSIVPLLDFVDIVLLMGVEPGFGGQSLILQVLQKITELVSLRKALSNKFLISIDGGVNMDTVKQLITLGADILVMGSAFFGAKDRTALVQNILLLGKS